MNNRTLLIIPVMLGFFLVDGRAQTLDITKMVQGTVATINTNAITVIPDNNGARISVATDTNTSYDGVQKLTDLKTADKIEVEYQTVHQKNRAITVKKMDIQG